LLIIPTIFHVLINGLDTYPKHILSYDLVDNQFLDRSCVIFPGSQDHRFLGSHAIWSHDVMEEVGSRDELHIGSCDKFPQSRDLKVMGL